MTETIHDRVRSAGLNLLRAARDSDQWDLMPSLFLISDIVDDNGMDVCVHVPISSDMWADFPVPVVLSGMAAGINSGAVDLEPEAPATQSSIVGVVLVTESWGVDPADFTAQEMHQLNEIRKNHDRHLSEHPRAVEMRTATMIDRAMTPGLLQHLRGKPISEDVIQGFTGRIPDALAKFMVALMTSWMAKTPRPD